MSFRKLIFWLHLIAGVLAGIVVLIMSVTGVLLTYEKQMIRWADPAYRAEPPSPDAPRLPVETLIEQVRQTTGKTYATITVRPGPVAPVEFSAGRESTVYVNPYTGGVLGEESRGMREFVTLMIDWHRWLAMKGQSRATGRAVTGASNLVFLFIVVSGIYLWWPKQWTLRHLRPIAWFQSGLGAKARDWNWHNTIGFWCAVPLFLVVISATVISYPWATQLVYSLTGSAAPAATKGGPPSKSGRAKGGEAKSAKGGERPSDSSQSLELAGLGAAVEHLRAQQDWETITVRPPANGRGPVAVSIERGGAGRPDLRTAYVFHAAKREFKLAENYSDYNAGRKARTWLRWIHTGEAGGIPGQTIAGIASLGAVFLVYTGIVLSLRRYAAWRRRKLTQSQQDSEQEVEAGVA